MYKVGDRVKLKKFTIEEREEYIGGLVPKMVECSEGILTIRKFYGDRFYVEENSYLWDLRLVQCKEEEYIYPNSVSYGDLIQYIGKDTDFFTKGNFYEVVVVNGSRSLQVLDDNDDYHNLTFDYLESRFILFDFFKNVKVGDKLMVTKKLDEYEEKRFYDSGICDEMLAFSGKIVTVSYVYENDSISIEEDFEEWSWNPNMFCRKIDYDIETVDVVGGGKLEVVNPDIISDCRLTPLYNTLTPKFKKKVYLASPFFKDEELLDMIKVLGSLRNKGLEVFAPFENQNKELNFGSEEWREATFKSDVEAIEESDIVVAIVGGNYMDSGTAWEIGYAYAKEKPVIIVNPHGETVNLMISDSLHAYLESLEELENYDFGTMNKVKYLDYVW